ncbi:MAG: PMT 2 domain-containing protein, partial [Bacteroidetes bacterium]|nr:PMT 2 domain-containing protein [Bacteroidota bacterium]
MNLLKEHRGILTVCGLFFVLGILRLNDLSLYTDSTRYLIWGTSVSQFKGYLDDTQPDPDRYVVNAPLYPVLLFPVLIAFPHAIIAAKIWTVLWGACALFLFHAWLANSMGRRAAILGTMFLALNPLMIVISSEVLSEAPFLALMFLLMILLDKLMERPQTPPALTFAFLVSASAVVLLREVSITLLAAMFFTLVVRRRGKIAFLLLACCASVYGLWLVRNLILVGETPSAQSSNIHFFFQHAVTPPDASFLKEMTTRIQTNARGFSVQLGGMLLYPLPPNLILWPGDFFKFIVNNMSWGKYGVMFVVSLTSVIGLVRDLRQSRSAIMRAIFIVFYMMIILTYPIHDFRFLLPLLPIMIFYVIKAIVWLKDRFPLGALSRPGIILAGFSLAMLPNAVCDFEMLRTNSFYVQSPQASNLPRHSTRKSGSPILKRRISRCRGVWPASGSNRIRPRKSSWLARPRIFPLLLEKEKCWRSIPAYHCRYLSPYSVTMPWNTYSPRDCGVTSYEFFMKESPRFWFEPVFSASNLHVFKVHSRWILSAQPQRHFDFDTVSAAGLLRKGRLCIVTEDYPGAVQALKKASALEPNQPESVFQIFLAYTLMGDSLNAIQQVQSMFTKPRSTPYVWSAQIHLSAMNRYRQAKLLKSEVQQSNELFALSKLYWNLGYQRRAYRLIRETIGIDPTFFSGLLWAWHYGIQTGDTLRAATYLQTLESIDRTNAVVKSFRAMTQFSDTLRRTKRPEERARLRLAIAREYDKMDLPEEAIDEAE